VGWGGRTLTEHGARGFTRSHAIQLAILRWWSRWYFGVTVERLDHLPEGPFLLAAAHHSILDGPLIIACLGGAGHPVAPLLARGILRFPVTLVSPGWLPIGIERGRAGGDVAALRAVLDALRSHPVLIFPEGGRRRGEVASGYSGAGWLALRAGVPVLPAVLLGTQRALPRGTWWPRRVPLTLRVGPAVDLTAAADAPRAGERADLATAAIMAAIARLEE
jgi:1-acyl-sn-glycerol-3-phosphate acyltransferase